jgi:hypothetical protein
MCRKINCACGKITWAGCGQHLFILDDVKDADRCPAIRTGLPPLPPSQTRDPCPAALKTSSTIAPSRSDAKSASK